MLTNTSQLHGIARKISAHTGIRPEMAQALTAFAVGIGDWKATLAQLAIAAPSYPEDWDANAAIRYHSVIPKGRGRYPDFQDLFHPQPSITATELAELTETEAIRKVVSTSYPYRSMLAETGLAPGEVNDEWLRSTTFKQDELTFIFTAEDCSNPDVESPVRLWEWNIAARDTAGLVVACARGSSFDAKDSKPATLNQATRAAIEVSSRELSMVRVLYNNGHPIGADGYLVVADIHVPPASRSQGLAVKTLCAAAAAMRTFCPTVKTVVVDLHHAAASLWIPPGCKVTKALAHQQLVEGAGKKLSAALAEAATSLIDIPIFSPTFSHSTTRNQTLRQIAMMANGPVAYAELPRSDQTRGAQIRTMLANTNAHFRGKSPVKAADSSSAQMPHHQSPYRGHKAAAKA